MTPKPKIQGDEKVVVVMPAYNAAQTLKLTYDDLPHDLIDSVILVDDDSKDETVGIAETLDIKVFTHSRNMGYGANQKTCYSEALKEKPTVIAMVHPDYQYDPTLLPEIVRPIFEGEADVVLGSRMMGISAYKQGMPWWKYVGNKVLTSLENLCFGLHLTEYHTGYRAYSSEVLKKVNFCENSDDFIFDQEIISQIVKCRFRIAEVPVPVRYFPESSSISLFRSILYGVQIVTLLVRNLYGNLKGR